METLLWLLWHVLFWLCEPINIEDVFQIKATINRPRGFSCVAIDWGKGDLHPHTVYLCFEQYVVFFIERRDHRYHAGSRVLPYVWMDLKLWLRVR
jgi:hypothetical protein